MKSHFRRRKRALGTIEAVYPLSERRGAFACESLFRRDPVGDKTQPSGRWLMSGAAVRLDRLSHAKVDIERWSVKPLSRAKARSVATEEACPEA